MRNGKIEWKPWRLFGETSAIISKTDAEFDLPKLSVTKFDAALVSQLIRAMYGCKHGNKYVTTR